MRKIAEANKKRGVRNADSSLVLLCQIVDTLSFQVDQLSQEFVNGGNNF